jgi:acetyl-CoA acetyltransferase
VIRGEDQVVISGIGQSDIGLGLMRSDLDLTIEASLRAIEDAGLDRTDIDGIATYPSRQGPGIRYGGFAGPATLEIQDALRLDIGWHAGGSDGPGHTGAIFNAIGAVCSGLCRHVLVYRTVTESSQKLEARSRASSRPSPPSERPAKEPTRWSGGGINIIAAAAQRHFAQYGTRREMLGALAINSRRNAGLNPKAVLRSPITMDDYLDARWISTPFGLLDCDILIDASTAFVISRVDAAGDAPAPVEILAMGSGVAGRTRWEQRVDLTSFSQGHAADMMWSRTDLTVNDVGVFEIYDGFSFLTLTWVEALGLAPLGQGGALFESGEIALGGRFPLNTHGGQMSEGRTHGFGMLHEACVQVRGDGGDRQVHPTPEVALTAIGGLGSGCFLLGREN